MPRIDELPMPAQNEIRARRGELPEAEHPEKRRMTLLQRLASVGLGRRDHEEEQPMRTLGQVQTALRALPPVDARAWQQDLRHADVVFGADDPIDDPWDRREQKE